MKDADFSSDMRADVEAIDRSEKPLDVTKAQANIDAWKKGLEGMAQKRYGIGHGP